MINGTTFIRRFFASEMIGFLFGVPVATAYALLLVRFDPPVVQAILEAVGVATVAIVVLAAIPTNHVLTRGLAVAIDRLATGTASATELRELFVRLTRLPVRHGVLLFSRIGLGAALVTLYAGLVLSVSGVQMVAIFGLALYGAYIAALIAYIYVFNLVRGPCEALVKARAIDPAALGEKGYLGVGFFPKSIIFLMIPAIYVNCAVFLFFAAAAQQRPAVAEILPALTGVLSVNAVTLMAAVFLHISSVHRRIRRLEGALRVFASDAGDLTRTVPTTLADELAHINHLINGAIGNFRRLMEKVQETGATLSRSTHELTAFSQQLFTTSNNQAASVKEIVNTMEDADKLSKEVREDVGEVAEIASRTQTDVSEGVTNIRTNHLKMEEIKRTNAETIEGIKALSEQIKNVWEVVNLIGAIASQTKIIAFNAELQASAAGAEGKRFEIVASEVRRLVDSTVASTGEIQGTIGEIGATAERLIESSETGTVKIAEGWELSMELERVFDKILASSETAAGSAERITRSVDQQVMAFEQILQTLKDISAGVEQLVEAAGTATRSAKSLDRLASDLNRIVTHYVV